jgi:hypothetical protein
VFCAHADPQGSAELLFDPNVVEDAIPSGMGVDMERHLIYSVSLDLLFKHAFYSSRYRSIPIPDCQAFYSAVAVVPPAIVGRF